MQRKRQSCFFSQRTATTRVRPIANRTEGRPKCNQGWAWLVEEVAAKLSIGVGWGVKLGAGAIAAVVGVGGDVGVVVRPNAGDGVGEGVGVGDGDSWPGD